MSGGELIFVVALAAWCSLRKMDRRLQKACRQPKPLVLPVQLQRDIQSEMRDAVRAIEEEVAVINKTKDPETAMKCFAASRRRLSQMAAEAPHQARISMLLSGKELCHEIEIGNGSEMETLSLLEKDWLRSFFKEKIDMLLKQSNDTQDSVLRAEHLRDAVRAAHKGLEYLPDDRQLTAAADRAEGRLRTLISPCEGEHND